VVLPANGSHTSEEAQFHRPVQGEGQPCAFGYGLDVDRHAVAGAFIPACARSTPAIVDADPRHVQRLAEDDPGLPCGLLGHSLGGAASLVAAQRLRTMRSVVTFGAPSSPAHVRNLFDDPDGDGPIVILELGGRRFEVARSFLDSQRPSTRCRTPIIS
jgi:pimeloyl-ACP methyl ester carboxylesterase